MMQGEKDFSIDCGYILINAAECEPGLEHNTQQIETQTDKVNKKQ